MNEYEKVEKLREKTNVTYEEAKTALEQNNWDLLDAIVQLEREGKVSGGAAHHSTKAEETAAEPEDPKSRFAERAGTFRDQIRKIIAIGNRNQFAIHHNGRQILSMPVTVLVILLLCLNVWGLVALAAGLFFGLRYSVIGSELGKPEVNDVMDKAADAAENMRETVGDSLRKDK